MSVQTIINLNNLFDCVIKNRFVKLFLLEVINFQCKILFFRSASRLTSNVAAWWRDLGGSDLDDQIDNYVLELGNLMPFLFDLVSSRIQSETSSDLQIFLMRDVKNESRVFQIQHLHRFQSDSRIDYLFLME